MEQNTLLVLAQYREGSEYAGEVGTRYHFPKRYFNFLTLPNIEFIYYEPKKTGLGVYFGYGEVGEVGPDPENPNHFYANILNYRKFATPVSGTDQRGQSREAGPFYNAQNAVRKIDSDIFAKICSEGGVELETLGVETERADSDELISEPFDPSKIKVDRDSMSVFQVLRKISLNEIVLNPDFQRNVVWDPVRRSRLVESALLRIPLPAFYFDGVDANRWVVIDGLQRLSTLRDFVTDKRFRLQGLEYLVSIEGSTFEELTRGMQRDLEETPVTLFIIRPETPPEVKFTIFYRINTGGLVLTAQEIRHALFQGQATALLKRLAETQEFASATDDGVGDVRMDARECVLRYLAFRLYPYQDYSKADLNSFLSTTMEQLNRVSPSRIEELDRDFREAMTRAREIFGRFAYRKFNPETSRRGPVNKALFESWSNVLQTYELGDLIKNKEKIRTVLGNMFTENTEYVRSLSAGTGGVRAVQLRFQGAHEAVKEALQ